MEGDLFACKNEFYVHPLVAAEIHFFHWEKLIKSIGTADLVCGTVGFLSEGMIRIFGVPIDLELDALAQQFHPQQVILTAETVIAIDKEPESAAISQMPITEGEGQVLAFNLKTEMAEGESAAVNGSTRLPAAWVASAY